MKPTITKITIGRLHNLGNFEHIRYEVTVEIPEGNHAGATIQTVTKLLDDLEPKPRHDQFQVYQARIALEKPAEERSDYESKNAEHFEKILAEHEAQNKQRNAAHEALGNLPVESSYKDAKDDWAIN